MKWLSIDRPTQKEAVFIIVLTLFAIALLLLPTGFKNNIYDHAVSVKAVVMETDNSLVRQFGIIKQGTQTLSAEVQSGQFKGDTYEAINQLVGKMELDKVFKPGDKILLGLDLDESGNKVLHAVAHDFYRLKVELVLFALFAGFLLLFAGWTGIKSLLSFVVSILMLWKVLVPGFLHGWLPPLPLALLTVLLLTALIMFLVGGLNKRGLISFLGSASGIIMVFILAIVFGSLFKIHGAVKPFTETLLYSGFPHLDLTSIFLATIVISSSGAIMDIAMDMASAMQEVKEKAPNITRPELIASGLYVGRAVIGTMTTTLLLAYSGSFMSLMMFFMAQGIPLENILNLTYVSSEILTTLAGSFGLVAVAPLTALIGGVLLVPSSKNNRSN